MYTGRGQGGKGGGEKKQGITSKRWVVMIGGLKESCVGEVGGRGKGIKGTVCGGGVEVNLNGGGDLLGEEGEVGGGMKRVKIEEREWGGEEGGGGREGACDSQEMGEGHGLDSDRRMDIGF